MFSYPFYLLLLVVSGLLGAGHGWAATLEEKVIEHDFPNGLKLLMVERPDTPTFTAYITIGVGSVDETSEYHGVAHLLEHMLFKGTETLGTTDFKKEKPLLERIEKVGSRLDELRTHKEVDPEEIAALEKELAQLQAEHKKFVVKDEFSRIYAEHGGVGYNAFTSKDLTTYLVSLPANKLELWATIESDRMQNAVLREFYTERAVVMEERRRSYETNPDGMLYENLLATAFMAHPYRHPVIGWMSDIKNLTLEETRFFLQSYYAPINTVIALVGDIDPEEAIEMVGRYFGGIDSGTPVPPIEADEPPQKGEKRSHIVFDAQPQLSIAYHKPTLPTEADYAFDLVDQILGQGPTSRLHRSLVIEKQLATSVSTYGAPGSRYPNLFVISAVPRYPHTAEEVEAAIYEEIEKLSREGVSEAELDQARNRLRADRLRFLRGNEGLARMLTYYQTVADDWRYLVTYDQKVASMDADDVKEVVQEYLNPKNRTVVTLGKGEDGE